MTIILLLVLLILALFPISLGLLFLIEGIKLIHKEGFSLSNCLSIMFGLLVFFIMFISPFVLRISNAPVFTYLYFLASLVIFYFSCVLAIFTLSAVVNLIHFGKKKNLDQIVVLGSGIFGTVVPPLLQNRIRAGIELQKLNPNALLILSGGQGPGEDIPEGAAMKAWALENGADPARTIAEEKSRNTWENVAFSSQLFPAPDGKTAIVSNSYHVFRALIFCKQQNISSIGYGAKTKWYFSLNAFLREFIAYLSISKKTQIKCLLIFLSPYLLIGLIGLLFH